MEKDSYAVVRALNNFRFYILHSHYVVYVPNLDAKSILTQQEIGCNTRVEGIEKSQEYDIKLKPKKLVWGNGLCKVIVENQNRSQEEELSRALMVSLWDPWFSNIAYVFTYRDFPDGLTYQKKRDL